MRALGPGSVSTVLKIALDVVWFVLWLCVAVTVLISIVAALSPANLTTDFDVADGPLADPDTRTAVIAAGIALFLLGLGGFLVIVQCLRRIFATLTAGDPFQDDNVRRLRVIGLALGALELLRYGVVAMAAWALPEAIERVNLWPNLITWFAVLVIFVLAEVFREGARLRREADLTI